MLCISINEEDPILKLRVLWPPLPMSWLEKHGGNCDHVAEGAVHGLGAL
jgi:hypothetical protein